MVGIVAGLAFAAGFYTAGVSTGRVTAAINGAGAESRLMWNQEYNDQLRDEGRPPRYPVPVVTDPEPIPAPRWADPMWAGLSAALGHAFALAVWFVRPALHAAVVPAGGPCSVPPLGDVVGIVPLVLIKLWMVYAFVLHPVNVYATMYDEPFVPDPISPFGPALAAGLVVVLALEPWRGVRLAYRCGWWPALGVLAVLASSAALYIAGGALLPGAV